MFLTPPIVAIVGRTNVGKSTLFNRLLEHKKALVSDIPGTTRDRNEGDCLWRGRVIRLTDTGGMDVDIKDEIEQQIFKQTQYAMKHADVLLFVVDAKVGAMPQERTLAAKLRASGKPIIVVANKAETLEERISVENAEWKFKGLESPVPISAIRGNGVGDLLDRVYDLLDTIGKPAVDLPETENIKVAVIGKPNVGKSTLINAIIGEERFIVSPVAHTTREPNDTLVLRDHKRYVFIDTAGMRKQGKVKKAGGLEAEAVRRNEQILTLADVTLLVVDASQPLGAQDKTLAGLLKRSGCAIIVVANKWDLIEDKRTNTMNEFRRYIADIFPFLAWAPVLFVSAKTKQRVRNVWDEIDRVASNRSVRIRQIDLMAFLAQAKTHSPLTKRTGGRAPKLLGLTQKSTNPPEFELMIKAKRVDALPYASLRFLEHRLRETFHLVGTPVRIHVRIAT